MPKQFSSSDVGDYASISITPALSKLFKKLVAGKLRSFLQGNTLLPPSQFSYCRGLITCDALFTLSHQFQDVLDGA